MIQTDCLEIINKGTDLLKLDNFWSLNGQSRFASCQFLAKTQSEPQTTWIGSCALSCAGYRKVHQRIGRLYNGTIMTPSWVPSRRCRFIYWHEDSNFFYLLSCSTSLVSSTKCSRKWIRVHWTERKFIGNRMNLMLQKGYMEDGPGKHYGVMVGQKPCGTINQVGRYWQIQERMFLPSIKVMAAIFAMTAVWDRIFFVMEPSKGYMDTKGMVFTPTPSCPKSNAFSRCPSSYRRLIVLCFLLVMVLVPALLLIDMLKSQIVTELLSMT